MGKNNRGQISSFDALIAITIFIFIFAVLRGMWINSTETALNNFEYMEMQLKSEQAIDSLIKTQGYPSNWNINNVELIGLAEKPSILSEKKVAYFILLDYNSAITKLGLDEYKVRLDINSILPGESKIFGVAIDSNKDTVSLKRTVIYKGGEASVTLKVAER